ncbi:hypothetical protein TNCT1_66230 [Streptomyces sp. 1-11]|nr:hypothetical protein TNCT1_66230 [Streptomyces sp. 1-11]
MPARRKVRPAQRTGAECHGAHEHGCRGQVELREHGGEVTQKRASKKLGQVVQVGLRRVQSRAQDQWSSLAAAGYRGS